MMHQTDDLYKVCLYNIVDYNDVLLSYAIESNLHRQECRAS